MVSEPGELVSERLRLRRWQPEDRAPFAALNADEAVMEFFPTTLTTDESDAMVDRMQAHFTEHGFGLWATERVDTSQLIGFVGLTVVSFDARFTPAVEVGWRLATDAWGHGFATEAATEVLHDGFGRLGLTEVVSMTAAKNRRSRAVMERLGFHRDPQDDFDHPRVEIGDPLRRHVLYRITAQGWVPRE